MRCGLLCAAPAASVSVRSAVEFGHAALHLEGLLVGLAADRHHRVVGTRKPPSLEEFLKSRLAVLGEFGLERSNPCTEERLHHPLGSVEAPVDEHCGDHGLERVAKNRGFGGTPCPRFAGAKPDAGTEVEVECHLMQDRGTHKACPRTRQCALVGLFEAVEQRNAHDQTQYRIAEELEALAVRLAETAVGERFLEQCTLYKGVAQALLELPEQERAILVPDT